MNKQALAFISMFTLVLMLSIYYVSLDTTFHANKPINDITSVMSLMNEQNNEVKELKIFELKEQLGLASLSENKKVEILAEIENIEDNKIIEEKIVDILLDKEIKSVVCIDNDIANINIFEIEESNEKAEQIMSLIYKTIKPNQTIELIFS